MSLTPEQIAALEKSMVGPASASTDGTSMTARSVDDTIKAIEYAEGKKRCGGALSRSRHEKYKVPRLGR